MRHFIDIVEGHTPSEFDPGDDEFFATRDKTGFFGDQGAGCLLMARSTGRIMLCLRAIGVEEAGTWGNNGGAFKKPEQPHAAALRELQEETGFHGEVELLPLLVYRKGDFTYFNYLAIVDDEFIPSLGWEATDYRWCHFGDWPQPLHFGPAAVFADAASVRTIKGALTTK